MPKTQLYNYGSVDHQLIFQDYSAIKFIIIEEDKLKMSTDPVQSFYDFLAAKHEMDSSEKHNTLDLQQIKGKETNW
jgi:hypothetical protein